jgi:hypothetical protein
MDKNHLNICEEKYKNVFVEREIMTKEICEWIMYESNKKVVELYGGWKNERKIKYPTHDILITNLPESVINLIKIIFEKKIVNVLYKNYTIPYNYKCHLTEGFVIRYDLETQTKLGPHMDDTDMTISILLSDENTFEGGGMRFKNGLTVHPNQGDAIFHCSKHEHEGLEIISGVRMILVFFIDIVLKI